jgi:hypothetical protein
VKEGKETQEAKAAEEAEEQGSAPSRLCQRGLWEDYSK